MSEKNHDGEPEKPIKICRFFQRHRYYIDGDGPRRIWGGNDHFVHAFHMPMFFFVSGYFFSYKRGVKNFLISRLKRLLIPFALYTGAYYFIWRVFFDGPRISFFDLFLHMNDSILDPATALWFIEALIISNLIYLVFQIMSPNMVVLHALVCAVALTGNFLTRFVEAPVVLALDSGMVGVGMMHIGYMFRKSESALARKSLSLRGWQTFVLAAVTTVLIFYNDAVNMRVGNYGFIPLFWLNAVASCIVLWNISKYLEGIKVFEKIYSLIAHVGERSMAFLCLNNFLILQTFRLWPADGSAIYNMLHNVVVFVLVMLIIYMADSVYLKVKHR